MPRPRRAVAPQSPLPPVSSSAPTLAQSLAALSLPPPPPPSSSPSSQKCELRVVLYDRPRYVPASSCLPPQPPISLVPPRDDFGAFIVDKVVTPLDWGQEVVAAEDYDSDEEDDKYRQHPERQTVKRVLNYVVGWPDVPYARQLVPCTQILDYVSPRTLEDWEYALTERQRREREEAKAEAEANAAKKKKHTARIKDEEPQQDVDVVDTTISFGGSAAPPAAVPSLSLSSPHTKEQAHQQLLPRRRGPQGRKKRGGGQARTAAATAARVAAARAANTTTPTRAAPAAAATADSSTTRTPRPGSSLAALSSLSGLYNLQIQLDSTTMSGTATSSAPHLSSPSSEQQQQLLVQNAASIIPSLASGNQRTGLSLKRPFQKFVEQQMKMPEEAESSVEDGEDVVVNSTAWMNAPLALGGDAPTTATTTAETSANEEEMNEIADSDQDEGGDDDDDEQDELQRDPTALLTALPPLRSSPAGRRRQPEQPQPHTHSHRMTHIPPPAVPFPKQRPPPGPRPSEIAHQKRNAVTPIPPPVFSSSHHPLHPPLVSPAPAAESRGGSSSADSASGGNSKLKRKRQEETPIPAPPIPTQQTRHHRHRQEQQKQAPIEETPPPPDVEEEEEDLYEVDRLEADCLLVVDDDADDDAGGGGGAGASSSVDGKQQPGGGAGRVVRFFRVRWKGDWPPDQNPTWEPAENLPPRMVRQYLKRAAQQESTAAAEVATAPTTLVAASMVK